MGLLNVEKKVIDNVVIENILHDSTNVIKTSYNYNTGQLYVTFKNGGVYYYNGVAESVYDGLKTSQSVGKYINAEIKPNYTVSRVGDASKEILSEMVNKITEYKSANDNNQL